jgi:hypothetical protein
MSGTASMKKIEKELGNLSLKDQRALASRLDQRLRRKSREAKPRGWTRLYGLGKGIWGRIDAQSYVNRLREDRV